MSATSQNDETITGINVTPLVDVVLVLLVVLMVTATYIASRSIPMDLPRGETGEELPSAPLAVSLDKDGQLYLDGKALDAAALRAKIRERITTDRTPRALIAADGAIQHRRVVALIDLLRQEQITQFAINVEPGDLHEPAP
jgi:biopolymer transport protein ExbD